MACRHLEDGKALTSWFAIRRDHRTWTKPWERAWVLGTKDMLAAEVAWLFMDQVGPGALRSISTRCSALHLFKVSDGPRFRGALPLGMEAGPFRAKKKNEAGRGVSRGLAPRYGSPPLQGGIQNCLHGPCRALVARAQGTRGVVASIS
jgi:hypothetical protein